tara:strand:+ start:2196 stop:2396 length:201 start_codon:yes stop_codon:yes gene_type:complete
MKYFDNVNYELLAYALLIRNASQKEIETSINYYKEQTINFDEDKLYHAIETHPLSLNDEGAVTNAN